MRKRLNRLAGAIIAIAAITAATVQGWAQSQKPETSTRYPVTTQQVGVYGNVWRDWFMTSPFRDGMDFIALQYRMQFEDFVPRMKALQNEGIDTFIILQSFDPDGKRRRGNDLLDEQAFQRFLNAFSGLIRETDPSRTMGFSISEENPPSHAPYLTRMYLALKGNFPERHFYQWYSSALKIRKPGVDWPALPNDGWVFDDYTRPGPDFGRVIDQYSAQRLPIATIWLAPNWKPGQPRFNRVDPTWWNTEGRQTFYEQVREAALRKAPIAFFAYELNADRKPRALWLASSPCRRVFWRTVLEQTIPVIRSGMAAEPTYAGVPDWVPYLCED